MQPSIADIERFCSKVLVSSGCWYWQGALSDGGYGYFSYKRKQVYAHRFAKQLVSGESELTVEHTCGNPPCVRPSHLQYMPLAENILSGRTNMGAVNARKTHCLNGHEFTPANTKPNHGGRACRTCYNEQARKTYKIRRTNSHPLPITSQACL